MDNTARGFARKIISELESIKRLIADATSNLQQKHTSVQRNDTQHEGGKNETKSLGSSPPKATGGHTTETNNPRFPRLTAWKPVFELVGLLVIIGYTTVAAFQWHATREANRITQETLKTTRDNFRQEQRPYVWLKNDLLFPGHIDATKDGKINDRRATWDWHFTNYGKTPALHIKFLSKMNIGEQAMTERRELGPSDATGPPLPPGKDDFSTAISPRAVTIEELNRLVNGFDGSVLIYGRIEYTDAAGIPYETAFCFHTLRTHAVQYCKEDKTNYMK